MSDDASATGAPSTTDSTDDLDTASSASDRDSGGPAADQKADQTADQTANGPEAQPSAVDDDSDDDSDDENESDDEDGDEDGEDNPLDTEGEIAADYLEELLDIADFDGDIDTYVESNRAHVSVLTEGDVLVGTNGEVLDALQELSRLAVMTETGNRSRLMLDIGGYRDKRRQQLIEVAGDAVKDVQESGDSVRLQPMNPFERKIVHDAVAAAGLSSESEGEEPRRRVVVMPRG